MWQVVCPLGWELAAHSSEPSEGLLGDAERRIVELNALLTPEQRQAVANVAVFGWLPMEFYVRRTGMRRLPADLTSWQALLGGLDTLAGNERGEPLSGGDCSPIEARRKSASAVAVRLA